ncbi:MAG: hypothetical protein NVS9B10_16790 [Nevskia sp.]
MTPLDSLPAAPAERTLRWLKAALLLVFLLSALRIAWLCDDAFISFRTVDNFVHGYGLTWNTDERVQAYTHPLWLFVISAAHALTREIYLTAIAVSVLTSGAAVAVVLFRLTADLPRALLFVALLLLSQALLDFSSSGLENPLSYLLVALFVLLWQAPGAAPRRLSRLFLIGGLAALNRQDLVLLLGPALAVAFWPLRSWSALRRALLALSPLLVWELFSLVYYGFPFPNTYYAKLNTGIPAQDYLLQGLIYLEDTLVQDPATLLILLLGLVFAAGPGTRRLQAPLAAGMALYLAYVVSVGGDFMQGRFLSVPAFLGAILLVQHPAVVSATFRAPLGALLVVAATLANLLFVSTHYGEGLTSDQLRFRRNGIANERQFYQQFGQGLSRLDRSSRLPWDHPWASAGAGWRAGPGPHVEAVYVAGITGYTAGPTVHLVDRHALSEPLLARLPIAGGWRIGHFERRLPPGLLESLRTQQNRIADPGLAQLYERLNLVTRGPLWSWPRFKAIAFLNGGGYRALLAGYLAPLQVPIAALSEAKSEHHPWNGPGTLTLAAAGLDVRLDGVRHEHRLSASLDNNDDYQLGFYLGAELAGELHLRAAYSGNGLHVWQLDLPPAAVARGYDRIRVTPSRGDGYYSIGHLILETPPSVDPQGEIAIPGQSSRPAMAY